MESRQNAEIHGESKPPLGGVGRGDTPMSGRRVLVATLPPYEGGVPAKTRMLVQWLRRRGHQVTVAYYATLTDEPALSAPSWWLPLGRRPTTAVRQCFDGVPAVAIGAWLPELEFTYYWPTSRWRAAIAAHDRFIATGGTVLASYPLWSANVPHLMWCASTMIEDRQDRRAAMPWARRVLDRAVIGPVQAVMEKRIISGPAHLMVTSRHTFRHFERMGRASSSMAMLPVPVDADRFSLPSREAETGVIGFAARINDPRKNVPLLFSAFARARAVRPDLRLRLTGEPGPELSSMLDRLGIVGAVEFAGVLRNEALPDFYRGLDVLVIPSRQEGFGIVGVEAMACGVPVISTRCGGPEDFVIDGQTGFLTDHDEIEVGRRILEVVGDRRLRRRLSEGARSRAVADYSAQRFEDTLDAASRAVWGEAL